MSRKLCKKFDFQHSSTRRLERFLRRLTTRPETLLTSVKGKAAEKPTEKAAEKIAEKAAEKRVAAAVTKLVARMKTEIRNFKTDNQQKQKSALDFFSTNAYKCTFV